MDLLAAARGGDRAALGQLLTRVEGGAHVPGMVLRENPLRLVGITGPPGVGKSSLIARLAAARSDAGERIGIVAIDPTSPFSGGALLGDRIRMEGIAEREGIFIRSLASRGETGGLAPAALRCAEALAAAGYAEVFLETVGSGQTEVEISRIAQTRVVVLSPGTGDGIQALKAGLLEIADIFVVNKDDEPGADAAAAALELAVRESAWKAPILRASAREGRGIVEILAALARHAEHLARSGEGERRLAERRRFAFRSSLLCARSEALARSRAVRAAEEAVASGEADPYEAARRLSHATFGHAALASKYPAKLAEVLTEGLGLAAGETEEVPSEGVRVRFFPLAEGQIEVLEPLSPENAIARYIEKRGGGIHHLTIEVSDFDATLARLRARGVKLAGEPRAGAQGRRVLFIHPEATGGILIEVISISAPGA